MKSVLQLVLAMIVASVPRDTVTAGALERATPAELAARLLPPADAARIVGARIRPLFFTRGYTVVLWERSMPVGPMICRQPTHTRLYIDLTAAGRQGDPNLVLTSLQPAESFEAYGTTYPAPATAERCTRAVGYLGVAPHLASPTISALTRLIEAIRAAAAPGPLPFSMRCRTDDGEQPCADERAALASLPLDQLWGVEFNRDYYTPRGAPPAPPGEAIMPTMQFGMSAPDGRSWFVTLIGDSDRLREVVMRRTMVIYH